MLYLDGTKYLNSQLAYTGSAEAGSFDRSLVLEFVTSAKYFYLGLGSFWGSADAYFDDLMIYNRELSADDVKGLNTLLNRVNVFDAGTAVGIDEIVADRPGALRQRGIYDLMGRRVTVPGKGIYIVNGKKVLFD